MPPNGEIIRYVPSFLSLKDLHDVLQVAVGWTDNQGFVRITMCLQKRYALA